MKKDKSGAAKTKTMLKPSYTKALQGTVMHFSLFAGKLVVELVLSGRLFPQLRPPSNYLNGREWCPERKQLQTKIN